MPALPNPSSDATVPVSPPRTAWVFALAYLGAALSWVVFKQLLQCLFSELCYPEELGSTLAFALIDALPLVCLGAAGILLWLRKREERCGSFQVAPLGPVLACFIGFSLVGRLGFNALIEFWADALWSVPSVLLSALWGVGLICDALLPLGLALSLSKQGLRGTPRTVTELPTLPAGYLPAILALGLGGLSSVLKVTSLATHELLGALLHVLWLGVVFLAARQGARAAPRALPLLRTVGGCLVLFVLEACVGALLTFIYKIELTILPLPGAEWLLQGLTWLLHGALLWPLTRLSLRLCFGAQPSAR